MAHLRIVGWQAGLLCLATVAGVLLAAGCGRRHEEAGAKGQVRVSRYNVNLVEPKDVVDIYAEALNMGARRSAPMRVRAVLAPGGKALASATAFVGRLEPGERRPACLHLTGCTGRLRQRDLRVFPEESTDKD